MTQFCWDVSDWLLFARENSNLNGNQSEELHGSLLNNVISVEFSGPVSPARKQLSLWENVYFLLRPMGRRSFTRLKKQSNNILNYRSICKFWMQFWQNKGKLFLWQSADNRKVRGQADKRWHWNNKVVNFGVTFFQDFLSGTKLCGSSKRFAGSFIQ